MATPPVIKDPTFDPAINPNYQKREQALAEAKQFNADFPDLSPNKGGKGKGRDILALEKMVRELHVQMRSMRPPQCVVVNMNPFPLILSGPLHDGLVVNACPEGKDYEFLVIKNYGISVSDQGDAKYVPQAAPPMQLAYDYEREFGGEMGYGGVFYYPGTPDMLDRRDTPVQRLVDSQGNMETVTIGELYKRARDRQLVVANQLYAEAENEWNKPNGQRNIITERHKRSALVLLRAGSIAEKPVWISLTRSEANLGVNCPACSKQLKKNVVKCDACGHFLDVMRAWELGMMTRDNPALRLLGPDALIKLNFSDEEIAWLCPGFNPETHEAAANGKAPDGESPAATKRRLAAEKKAAADKAKEDADKQ